MTKFKRKQNDIQTTKKNRTKMRKNDKSKLKIKKMMNNMNNVNKTSTICKFYNYQ